MEHDIDYLILQAIALTGKLAAIGGTQYIESHYFKIPYHTSTLSGQGWVQELLDRHLVRYRSPMNLWQVYPAPSSSATPFPSYSLSYFHHISNTPPFIPVPLVSPFVPMSPVSLISISMSLWSSCLSHIVSSPHSCLSLFHASTFCS